MSHHPTETISHHMVRRTARARAEELNEELATARAGGELLAQAWLERNSYPKWTRLFVARRAAPGIFHWVVKARG